jgi:3-oxoacid CoA-transferase subunit B
MALSRDQLVHRAAQELRDGCYVNLGIGIPTLIANAMPEGMDGILQSANGLLGLDPCPTPDEVDADLINAGKQTVTAAPGASCFSSADSQRCVHRTITDLAVIDVVPGREGLRLVDVAPGITHEEVQARTEPPLVMDHVIQMSGV